MLIDRPILVMGCSRSGTSLMFHNLAEHPQTWSRYEESYHIYHRHFPIDPELGERVAQPPQPEVGEAIKTALYEEAHNRELFADAFAGFRVTTCESAAEAMELVPTLGPAVVVADERMPRVSGTDPSLGLIAAPNLIIVSIVAFGITEASITSARATSIDGAS